MEKRKLLTLMIHGTEGCTVVVYVKYILLSISPIWVKYGAQWNNTSQGLAKI